MLLQLPEICLLTVAIETLKAIVTAAMGNNLQMNANLISVIILIGRIKGSHYKCKQNTVRGNDSQTTSEDAISHKCHMNTS